MNQLHTNWLRDWTVHPIPLSFSTGAIIDPQLQFPRSASDTSAAHLGSLSLSISLHPLSIKAIRPMHDPRSFDTGAVKVQRSQRVPFPR